MNDQYILNKYTSIKNAMELLGYASRTSINQLVDKGQIGFVIACKDTTSEVRLFSIKDIRRLKRKRKENK